MRRRNHLMRKRAELLAHIQNTASQYNHQVPLGRIAKPENREGLVERFELPSVQMSVAANLDMIETYDKVQELYFQNPTFGFYFLRLTTERLLQNITRLESMPCRLRIMRA